MAAKAQQMLGQLMAQAKPRLQVFLKYAAVELTPPSPGDIPAIKQGITKMISGAKSGAWKKVTVKEAWLNTLITAEVMFWFFAGECVGKHHIVGYKV